MMGAIFFGILAAAMGGYLVYDNRRIDQNAKKNAEQIREATLAEIDRAGLSVSDFPKHEDALRGERHLKVSEIVDIYYVCRTRRGR